jgi:hypothetical protein
VPSPASAAAAASARPVANRGRRRARPTAGRIRRRGDHRGRCR